MYNLPVNLALIDYQHYFKSEKTDKQGTTVSKGVAKWKKELL
jgi:hypothetical protein